MSASSAPIRPPTIKVLEIGAGFGVGAVAGQLFAFEGAEVRLLETEATKSWRTLPPLASDGVSYLFALINERKCLTHQPTSVADREAALCQAIDWCDVLIMQRDQTALSPLLEPKLFERRWKDKVLCAVSLFGHNSARREWIGGELIAEAAGGLIACTGYPERPPVMSGLPYALHTAALLAYSTAMCALWERDRSGLGQFIDLSTVDCLVALLGNFLPSYCLSGRVPQRIGNRHTIAAPWNIYPASDGSVVICTGTGGTGWWAKMMVVLARPELVADPRYATEADRVRNVEAVDVIVAEWTRSRPMKTIVEEMTSQGIPVSEISTIEAVLEDEHFRRLRNMIRDSDLRSDRGKPLPLVGIPFAIPDSVPRGERSSDADTASSSLRGRGDPLASKGPLAGLRVVEFASRTSAPLAGRLMADLGAEVVKIEPKKGDALRGAGQKVGGSSYLFHINNAGKQSIVIDPAGPEGRDLVLKLVAESDVFIENLAPGSLAKMGLGHQELGRNNPGLISCSVNGFGERSNYGDKRALDTVVQAASGLMHMTGYPDHFPVKLGISAIDLATATAVMAAVLSALRKRTASGLGCHIDLAMADVGVWMTQSLWPRVLCTAAHPIRLGNRSADCSPHDLFLAADGRFVALAVDSIEQWRALVGLVRDPVLEDPALEEYARRVAESERVETALQRWVANRNADAAAAACQQCGVPAAVVRDLADLVADPDLAARQIIVERQHPTAGPLRLLGNPMALSRTPPVMGAAAPLLGQHTRQVLIGWLGLDDDAIDNLEERGTIAADPSGSAAQHRGAAAHG